MSVYTEYFKSTLRQWRDGPISCFSWPLDTTSFDVFSTLTGNEVTHEEKNPNWREDVRLGRNATTRFTATEDSIERTDGYLLIGKWCTTSARFGWYEYRGDLTKYHSSAWNQPTAPSSSLHQKTFDEALTFAIGNARASQSTFRGGNFLAELADTIRGLRNPAKGFRQLVDTYHRNAKRSVKRAVGRRPLPRTQNDFRRLERDSPDTARAAQRALSDSWLEANFGWSPLLSDAQDAYLALRKLSARVPLVSFRGFAENWDTPTYVSQVRQHEVSSVNFTVRTAKVYDCTIYGAVKCNVDSPPSGQAIEEMGVRARDFLPAVWEAIPYSFLIDYFTNIGDVIEVMTFPTSDLAWAARTFRNHSVRSIERMAVDTEFLGPLYPANNSNKLFGFSPSKIKWSRKYVDRSVLGTLTVPTIRFQIPGPRSWKRYFNMVALARLRSL